MKEFVEDCISLVKDDFRLYHEGVRVHLRDKLELRIYSEIKPHKIDINLYHQDNQYKLEHFINMGEKRFNEVLSKYRFTEEFLILKIEEHILKGI